MRQLAGYYTDLHAGGGIILICVIVGGSLLAGVLLQIHQENRARRQDREDTDDDR